MKKIKYIFVAVVIIMTMVIPCMAEAVPESYITIHFGTYDELYSAFTDENEYNYIRLREKKEIRGDIFIKTIDAIESGDIKILIPQIDGKDITFKQNGDKIKFSFSGILFPSFVYNYIIEDESVRMEMFYPAVFKNSDIDNANSVEKVAPYICNECSGMIPIFRDMYKGYEREVELGNGEKTEIVVYEAREDKSYVYMYYKGTVITIESAKTIFTDEFFSSFDLVEYKSQTQEPNETDGVSADNNNIEEPEKNNKIVIYICTAIGVCVIGIAVAAGVVYYRKRKRNKSTNT